MAAQLVHLLWHVRRVRQELAERRADTGKLKCAVTIYLLQLLTSTVECVSDSEERQQPLEHHNSFWWPHLISGTQVERLHRLRSPFYDQREGFCRRSRSLWPRLTRPRRRYGRFWKGKQASIPMLRSSTVAANSLYDDHLSCLLFACCDACRLLRLLQLRVSHCEGCDWPCKNILLLCSAINPLPTLIFLPLLDLLWEIQS